MTKANKELRAALKAAKPKGRPHIQRSAPEKRTWNGVLYDSKAEMEFHQAFPSAFRCLKGADTFDVSPHGKYTPDFYFAEQPTVYVEVKGTRYTPVRREPRPRWSDRAKAKFLTAQSCRWPGEFIVVIKHNGLWINGQAGEVLPGQGGGK